MHTNINSLNSDIPLTFSQVRVAFCFRESARARAPSESMLLPGRENISLTHMHENINLLDSDIRPRYSQVRTAFCFRDSARACAPSESMLLPGREILV